MNILSVTLLTLVAVASARHISLEDVIEFEQKTAFGYLTKVGIPLADKIRKAEEEASRDPSRIVGGSLAVLGQFPYQAGLLLHVPAGSAIAGGVLISLNRVLSAAHNFYDHVSSVTGVTVVLGSITIYTGGTRLTPTEIILHENYNIPSFLRNDIAMVNLPENVVSSSKYKVYSAQSLFPQLNEDFAGDVGVASGFGKTADIGGVTANQPLSYVELPVISNNECVQTFGSFVQSSNVCTSGAGGKNICTGDSGGPLAVSRNGIPILIGITSFGSSQCEGNMPSGYARVTYFIDWINERL